MIIKRYKYFSKKLKDSRIGIGWIDGMKKSDAESYLRAAQKAADNAYAAGKDEDKVVKSAKAAATKKALLDNSGKPLMRALKYGGGSYLASRFIPGDFINSQIRGTGIKNPELEQKISEISKKANKNAGKVGLLVGGAVLASKAPKVYKKVKAARLGAEINTKDRLKKMKKNKK